MPDQGAESATVELPMPRDGERIPALTIQNHVTATSAIEHVAQLIRPLEQIHLLKPRAAKTLDRDFDKFDVFLWNGVAMLGERFQIEFHCFAHLRECLGLRLPLRDAAG